MKENRGNWSFQTNQYHGGTSDITFFHKLLVLYIRSPGFQPVANRWLPWKNSPSTLGDILQIDSVKRMAKRKSW